MSRPLALQALAAMLAMLVTCTPTSAPTALTDTVWTLQMLHGRPLAHRRLDHHVGVS